MIKIDNLTKSIRGTEILKDITISMDKGRITGLVGPNGSGKTMLMRAIVGLMRPSKGSITLHGWNPYGPSKQEAARPSIGMLLEGPAFVDGLSGLENLKMLASIRGTAQEDDLIGALSSIGLDPKDKRKYRSYSLGMKQRLGLACAVMEHPDILVVDEPTNALDVTGVRLAVDIIKQEALRGATVVVACHDASIMSELAHEVWHLAEGHLEGHDVLDREGGEQ
ncbi:MAG: ABC transporter ATP-binding protein [Coriobacteriales bacterium]|nr:ABC transporter ATP-binding protein [Coriobacteriales bacterium]